MSQIILSCIVLQLYSDQLNNTFMSPFKLSSCDINLTNKKDNKNKQKEYLHLKQFPPLLLFFKALVK